MCIFSFGRDVFQALEIIALFLSYTSCIYLSFSEFGLIYTYLRVL